MGLWFTTQAVVAWVAWELDQQIRLGELSPKLLRPLDPLWEHWFRHLTEKTVRLPMALPLVAVGLWLVPGASFAASWQALAVYLVSVVLAANMRFFAAYCIGIICFWTDQATALDDFWFFVAIFAGGAFAPIELYPQWAQNIIVWTPWPYVTYYPVQILGGKLADAELWRVLLMQVLWLVVFVVLRQVLWRSGLKRYGAVGA
jgi:ABC-2 type transport system permease protein